PPPAACLPENPEDIQAIKLADSIALDPHKWLYAPLEAGCVLTKKREHLLGAFSYRPPYYHFHREDSPEWCNFYELGVQNSRGFRALKVWAALRQAGRQGYVASIRQDIALAKAMADHVKTVPDLELRSHRLSIVTFRFVPLGGKPELLDMINERILATMQRGGEAFVSNAVLSPLSTVHAANVGPSRQTAVQSEHAYYLRACVVNFRTQLRDVLETADLAAKLGREINAEVRAPAP
ncbi:MAG: pyridoxal-dependent decarboxylase, partial [Fimbriimonadaceae bacterium]